MTEYRVEFDAVVAFSNGGGLEVRGFRLDAPSDDVSPEVAGEMLVRHLGLLMVGAVSVTNLRVFAEPHKGSRGVGHGGAAARSGLVDLSHPIHAGMTTYPGLPGPEITDHLSREASRSVYAEGTEFHIGRISMVANTGTYVDSPFHRFDGGTDLAGLPLERLADVPGVVVRLTGADSAGIDRLALAAHEVAGRAVLLQTGWDRHWGTAAYGAPEHPFLTGDAAAWLVEQGAAVVGIDSVNIDDTRGPTRPAHTTLLEAGIPVVEHLRGLGELPPEGFRFHAVPAPVAGFGTFPVRAYAVLG